ncbi:MAG: acyltransferase family protein, partial [Lachnospiraceae bacterium]|nr:acyltransferase family protein [Lachnospiraceae bacterium]
MADRKRVAYIDLAKGIGMVLVLCGHLQNDTVFSFSPYIQGFCRWIFSFHMPMFFIISGMLFALKGEIPGMKAFFRKRFSSIMVPYFLFSAIYFLIIIYGVFVSHSMSIGDMYLQLWYALCFYGINVLWFLPALFFAELLFAFLVKKFSGKKRWIVMILLTVAALAINEARGFLPKEVFWWQRLDELIVTLIRPVIACSFVT